MITTILSDFTGVLWNPAKSEFNEELVNYYKTLKDIISINIFSTGKLITQVEKQQSLDPMFERIYVANDMGLSKDAENAYRWIVKDLGKAPEEILFIDDQMANIAAARQAGLKTIVFYNTPQAIAEIRQYAED